MLARKEHGIACSASQSVLEPGSGAPLHLHPDIDEILFVFEGVLDFRLGEERRVVGKGHTVSIPAGTPHGFVVIGSEQARLITFLPRTHAHSLPLITSKAARPEGADRK